MEEIEDKDGSFGLNFLSRFAGVSWDEAETNRGNGETTCKRGPWDESADGIPIAITPIDQNNARNAANRPGHGRIQPYGWS